MQVGIDRIAGEPDKAYRAYLHYRDLGRSRGYTEVAEHFGINLATLRNYSYRFKWAARAAAWDSEIERRTAEAEIAAIADMRRRHVETALRMQELGKIELEKILKRAQEQADESALAPKEVLEIYKTGVAQERLNRGEPETIQRVDVRSVAVDLGTLNPQELQIMRAVLAKLKQREEEAARNVIDADCEIVGE